MTIKDIKQLYPKAYQELLSLPSNIRYLFIPASNFEWKLYEHNIVKWRSGRKVRQSAEDLRMTYNLPMSYRKESFRRIFVKAKIMLLKNQKNNRWQQPKKGLLHDT
jgi:hypothetical protein